MTAVYSLGIITQRCDGRGGLLVSRYIDISII